MKSTPSAASTTISFTVWTRGWLQSPGARHSAIVRVTVSTRASRSARVTSRSKMPVVTAAVARPTTMSAAATTARTTTRRRLARRPAARTTASQSPRTVRSGTRRSSVASREESCVLIRLAPSGCSAAFGGPRSGSRRRCRLDAERRGDRRVVEVGVVAEKDGESLALGQGRDGGAHLGVRVRPPVPGRESSSGAGRVSTAAAARLRASFTTMRHTQASSGPRRRNDRRFSTARVNASCTVSSAACSSPTIARATRT